jgi:hypothetical protein
MVLAGVTPSVLTPAELTLAAALGAAALTGLTSLGVIAYQDRRRRKSGDRDALQTAVLDLLSRSMSIAYRARAMGETMKYRSGLKEGFDVTLRYRKPADVLELHDWMARDLVPMHAALDRIWTSWDQEGIRLANDVADKSGDLIGAATATTPALSAWDRVRIWAAGQRWTPEMIEANEGAMKDLAHARKRLADYARHQLGMADVNLFAQVDSADAGTAVNEHG